MINGLSREQLQERYAGLEYAALKFISTYDGGNSASEESRSYRLTLNRPLLLLVARSAYDDIYRYKNYHLGSDSGLKSDSVKRAAYVAKWVVRHRPIQIEQEDPEIDEEKLNSSSVLANQYFATALARAYLEGETKKTFQFSEKFLLEINYDLTYRDISADHLLSVIQVIKDMLEGVSPIDIT